MLRILYQVLFEDPIQESLRHMEQQRPSFSYQTRELRPSRIDGIRISKRRPIETIGKKHSEHHHYTRPYENTKEVEDAISWANSTLEELDTDQKMSPLLAAQLEQIVSFLATSDVPVNFRDVVNKAILDIKEWPVYQAGIQAHRKGDRHGLGVAFDKLADLEVFFSPYPTGFPYGYGALHFATQE